MYFYAVRTGNDYHGMQHLIEETEGVKEMKNVVDISKHQPSKNIDWPTFSKYVDLLIMRVQYGSTGPDMEYKNHVSNAKKYGVPFLSYAFPEFTSVADARVEAKDAHTREDAASHGMVIDIEMERDRGGNPVGISELPQAVRLEGIKAFVDELRKLGTKKVGAYIGHNVYESWGINTIIGIFDFVWIPRYKTIDDGQPTGTKPSYPCDIWQYSSKGRVPGFDSNLDMNVLLGNKTLEWYTGQSEAPTVAKPTPVVSKPAPVVAKPTPAPSGKTYKIKAGDTFWEIAQASHGTFTANDLIKWNPKVNPGALQIGQVINISAPVAKPVAPSFAGKKVVNTYKGPIAFRNKPSWSSKDVAGNLPVGYSFPTILRKIQVEDGYQYEVKNSKGVTYYVTASPTYVTLQNK